MDASERAYRLMIVYRQWADAEGSSDEEALTDLLADLMIHAEEYGIDWEEVESRARLHSVSEAVR